MTDMINHPPHYTSGPRHTFCGEIIECFDVVADRDYLTGATIKYLWRLGLKDDPLVELRKARRYLDEAIARLERVTS